MNDQEVVRCSAARAPAVCHHVNSRLTRSAPPGVAAVFPSTIPRGSARTLAAWAFRIATAVLVVAALTGCTGQAIREGSDSKYVQFVTITPEWLAANPPKSQTAGIPTELLNVQPQPYHIGVGDTLYITVWDHPELTSPAGSQQETAANGRLVRPDGTLFYPFIGDFKIAGMTIEQARQAITNGLAPFINKPQVDVSVIGYNSQHVLMEGAFAKTGPQPVGVVPLSLADAMGTAGVNTSQASLSYVIVSRGGHDYHIDLGENAALAGQIQLQPGDRVYLPYNDATAVYVLGEVVRPMAVRFKAPDLTLTQAVGEAGGLNQITAQGMLYVVRGLQGPEGHATVYKLDAGSPAAFALADQFKVLPGDVVFASASGITRWNRFLTQLLPLTNAISSAAASRYYIDRNTN